MWIRFLIMIIRVNQKKITIYFSAWKSDEFRQLMPIGWPSNRVLLLDFWIHLPNQIDIFVTSLELISSSAHLYAAQMQVSLFLVLWESFFWFLGFDNHQSSMPNGGYFRKLSENVLRYSDFNFKFGENTELKLIIKNTYYRYNYPNVSFVHLIRMWFIRYTLLKSYRFPHEREVE